jgi:hypothetical protein
MHVGVAGNSKASNKRLMLTSRLLPAMLISPGEYLTIPPPKNPYQC